MICFNLGYLPGSEHSKELTATRKETTVKALNAAVKIIKTKGLISIMAYIGHAGMACVLINAALYSLAGPAGFGGSINSYVCV